MHDFTLWCGFLGSWLLVAGPVYQAWLELQEESFESDRIRALTTTVDAPPAVSAWWWLLPPVRFVLARRRSRRYRRIITDAMTDEDFEQMSSFISKATGWMYVGVGAFLLALVETYELAHDLDWPIVVFWTLTVVMGGGCFANAALRIQHAEHERRARPHRQTV